MKLDIGCGNRCRPGFVGVDQFPLPGVIHLRDLNKMPWLYEDCSVDEVYASHWLEHMNDPVACMGEIYRILKPGGKVTLLVPHHAGVLSCARTHKTLFSVSWFHSILCQWSEQTEFLDDRRLWSGKIILHFIAENRYPHPSHGWPARIIVGLLRIMIWIPEWILNRHVIAQYAWEKSGILPPDEIVFQATKI